MITSITVINTLEETLEHAANLREGLYMIADPFATYIDVLEDAAYNPIVEGGMMITDYECTMWVQITDAGIDVTREFFADLQKIGSIEYINNAGRRVCDHLYDCDDLDYLIDYARDEFVEVDYCGIRNYTVTTEG